MFPENIYIIGAGGHAKVVISTIRILNRKIGGIFDDDLSKRGARILDVPVLGSISEVFTLDGSFIIAIGDNKIRKEIFERYSSLNFIKIMHPNAFVDQTVKVGSGTVIFAGAIIQPNCSIGQHSIINTGSSIDHDCEIGDFTHIAPGVNIAGGVKVKEGAFIGIGSSIIPNIEIGEWSQVGAGSVVIKDIPPKCLAYGNPARVVRYL